MLFATISDMTVKEIHLAHTKGFCAGVVNAIDIVERCIVAFGIPLYVRHAIVHNTSVIQDFESRGVVFIEDLDDVPDNQPVVFSAHGTAPDVYEQAQRRGLTIIDATCPLVTKVHRQAKRYSERGVQTILIGHRGHQELIGTSGYVHKELLHIVEDFDDIHALTIPMDAEIAVITQTTLSVDDTTLLINELKKRYPRLITGGKEDICYATQNRQDAVKTLASICDYIIICGSPNSSNSNRLVETSREMGVEGCIIDFPEDLTVSNLALYEKIGISSGASVPRYIVDRLIQRIQVVYPDCTVFEPPSTEKDIQFPLPKIISDTSPTK